MGRTNQYSMSSPSSSVNSSSQHSLSTDLRLGLGNNSNNNNSTGSQQLHHHQQDGGSDDDHDHDPRPTFFVKVYMEGIPIGRKLDLLAHDDYPDLITTLHHMFGTTIIWADQTQKYGDGGLHVLTYEDGEGDWMIVGDVPWEMFVTTVKRLKIARPNNFLI